MIAATVWFFGACATAPTAGDSAAEPPPPPVIEGRALARRLSLDLRGTVPTAVELAAADRGEVALLTEAWLAEPAFQAHLVEAFAADWLLRIDELRIEPTEFDLDADTYAFTRAIGDEPAQVLARVAAGDRPYTEVVTGDWTMVNSVLLEVEPVELVDASDPPTSPTEWREAHYVDGRPAGGVLMTSGLWLRYPTTLFNYNRTRAATLSRYLLCYDFLSRPVRFTGVDATTGDALQEATQTVPGCVACHSGLDPLAATLFGFWPFEDKDGQELVTYHPERERYAETELGIEPAYFGTPVDAASQLGPLVAADPRFDTCAVQSAAARYWGRPVGDDDQATLDAARTAFVGADRRYTALVRNLVESEAYRATTSRRMSPLTFASAVEDLTGFRWAYEGWDQLDSDESGYRVLYGGADGVSVRTPNLEPTVSRTLVTRRAAEAAAAWVVAGDAALPQAERRLVGTTTADPATLADDPEGLATELATVHERVLSRAPDPTELTELTELWATVDAAAGPDEAWSAVVGLLLRDPEFGSY